MALLLQSLCVLCTFSFIHALTRQVIVLNGVNHDEKTRERAQEFVHDGVYRGGWELASENSGVLAMHLFIFPNTNKAIMFDSLVFGQSQIQLPQGGEDPWAHAVEFDIDTAAIRPLEILTDTWSSSGGLSANGTFVGSGGWDSGGRTVRYLSGCKNCNWREYTDSLSRPRWYATQHILPDGRFLVVGGRRMFSYEYIPAEGIANKKMYTLRFLEQTTDPAENNLYPFVFLSVDGNVFIFSNNRSFLLNTKRNRIIREFPVLPGGSRNYPASAMAALLPINLHNQERIQAEVLICGGAKPNAAILAEKGIFLNALQDCGRIDLTDPKATWQKEDMPSPRIMGDMLLLPTGDVLMINGAKKGTSGWNFAEDPNLTPVLYRPNSPIAQRFMELSPTTIPRMYHSTSAVLPDGKVLVAGGNPNDIYKFTGVKYPTELRVEKFIPPYFDPLLNSDRPSIISNFKGKNVNYGQRLVVQLKLKKETVKQKEFKVTMYAPPFTTHGFSMGQRLLVLRIRQLIKVGPQFFQVTVSAPPSKAVAPPGFYLFFVLHLGVPSSGIWVQIA